MNIAMNTTRENLSYLANLHLREYTYDVPQQKKLVKRIALAAIPFLALSPTLHLPIALVMGSLRVINSKGFDRGRAITSLACSILNLSIGNIFSTIDDLIRDIQRLRSIENRLEATQILVKIGNHLLYLGFHIRGGMELYLLSCASHAAVNLLQSIDEFQKDRWIEGTAHLLMTSIRLRQVNEQWSFVKKFKEIQTLVEQKLSHATSEKGTDIDNSSLLLDIIAKRHSGKDFENRPLSRAQIEALVQSARWAPSSYNDQPWNFIFCDRYTHPDSYAKAIDSIYGQEWAESAPLLVISVVRPEFRYNQQENGWAQYDTGAAALSMSLQATALGLMAHQIGGFDPETIQEEFHLPNGYQPISIIAIGYEKYSDAPINEERLRRPVDENFFFGDWDQQFPMKLFN